MKTNELIEKIRSMVHMVAPPARELLEQAADRLEELDKERRWIPVTERLPEYGQVVVVRVHFPFDENARMAVTPYNPNYNPHFWERVTHWMPLPEPPKEEA